MIQSKIRALGHSKIPEEAIMRMVATCVPEGVGRVHRKEGRE